MAANLMSNGKSESAWNELLECVERRVHVGGRAAATWVASVIFEPGGPIQFCTFSELSRSGSTALLHDDVVNLEDEVEARLGRVLARSRPEIERSDVIRDFAAPSAVAFRGVWLRGSAGLRASLETLRLLLERTASSRLMNGRMRRVRIGQAASHASEVSPTRGRRFLFAEGASHRRQDAEGSGPGTKTPRRLPVRGPSGPGDRRASSSGCKHGVVLR